MLRLIEKCCALLIAIAYVVAMLVHDGASRQTMICSAALLLPLACIWFPDQLGDCTGIYVSRGQTIDAESPPALVSILGWILLVIPAFVYFRTLR